MMQEHLSSCVSTWLDGVECFRAAKTLHRYPRHSHDFYSIGVIEDGIGGNYCRGATHEMPAGSIVFMNPDEVHTGYAVGGRPLTYRMLHIDPGVFRQMAPGLASLRFSIPKVVRPGSARRLGLLHRELEFGADPLREEEQLIETLTELISSHGTVAVQAVNGREPKAVKLIKDYLEAHYPEKILLSQLAGLAKLDRAYLIRSFRRAAGMPPHEFLTQVRVRHAAGELARGEPIADVAGSAGFADQSHLTRHFKRITGTTPGEYAAGHFRSRR
jgi:AraC-like DNA-binding protein